MSPHSKYRTILSPQTFLTVPFYSYTYLLSPALTPPQDQVTILCSPSLKYHCATTVLWLEPVRTDWLTQHSAPESCLNWYRHPQSLSFSCVSVLPGMYMFTFHSIKNVLVVSWIKLLWTYVDFCRQFHFPVVVNFLKLSVITNSRMWHMCDRFATTALG